MRSEKMFTVNQIKINNIKKILSTLLSNSSMTKLDLVLSTSLSTSTVSECINNLLKQNVVLISGMEESLGGRKPAIYSLNHDYGAYIGIVISNGFVSASLISFDAKVLKSYEYAINSQKSAIVIIYEIIELILKEYENLNILAIGFGIIGSIDSSKGIVNQCYEIGWNNVHLKELIERKYFIPTFVEHKVNNGTLYENILGSAKGLKNYMCLYDVCSEKCGLMIDGKICRSNNNLCGTTTNEVIEFDLIERISAFLSLDTIFIGGFIDTKLSNNDSEKYVSIKITEDYFAKAAAIMAELNWFEVLYYKL